MPQTFNIQGVAVPLSNTDYFSQDFVRQGGVTISQYLDRIVGLGMNEVRLLTSFGQLADPTASTYTPYNTQSLASLKLFTDAALARGLTISVAPLTAFAGRAGQALNVNASDPAAWFSSWRGTVLQQAALARDIGAERFAIMSDIEQFMFTRHPDLADDLVALIGEIRAIYKGSITSVIYTSDGSLNDFPMEILKALDLVGLGFYPKLTKSTTPTLGELEAAFHNDVTGQNIVKNLADLAHDTGKHIWFSDIAQGSYDGALRYDPVRFSSTATFIPDDTEQVLGYQSIINTMMQYGRPWFEGMSVQNMLPITSLPPGRMAPAYFIGPVAETFWGKPGEQVLRDYFTGKVATPVVELRGSNYGETITGASSGPMTIYAGQGVQTLSGGPKNDTFYAAAIAKNVPVHELKITALGSMALGELPSFAVRVNGQLLPVELQITSTFGAPHRVYTIPIFTTEPITSIDLVTANHIASPNNYNRFIDVRDVTLDGVKLAGAIYHPANTQATEAFVGQTTRGGYVTWNTAGGAYAATGSVNLPANSTIDGGEGRDTVVYAGNSSDHVVTRTAAGWTVQKPGAGAGEGLDTLTNVEVLQFSDRAISLAPVVLPAAIETAFSNILRTSSSDPKAAAAAGAIDTGLTAGSMTPAQAIAELVKAADATTSVATLSYQFFTGKIPGLGGVDYLVSPTGPNPNNLNSAYYQSFNLENRYINFAVNLGKNGDGKEAFAAAYGSKTLAETVKGVYAIVFGSTPTDAKVAALLAGGRDAYFAAYGQDGPTGIGTKAAAVGWLLAEAAKADVGMYSKANDAFLADLADGANFAIDIVGVYGRPEYAFTG